MDIEEPNKDFTQIETSNIFSESIQFGEILVEILSRAIVYNKIEILRSLIKSFIKYINLKCIV